MAGPQGCVDQGDIPTQHLVIDQTVDILQGGKNRGPSSVDRIRTRTRNRTRFDSLGIKAGCE
ncbi:MAG TPA: hypothetical protein VF942_13960, partial [Acidimicrobiales bacterium]